MPRREIVTKVIDGDTFETSSLKNVVRLADVAGTTFPICIACNRESGLAGRPPWHGRRRAPLSAEKRRERKIENGVGGALLGTVVGGAIAGHAGARVGAFLGAALGASRDPEEE